MRGVTDEQVRAYEGVVFTTSCLVEGRVEQELDDIRQQFRIKVAQALASYDPSKTRLAERNYVFMCMMNLKKDMLKKNRESLLFIEDLTSNGELMPAIPVTDRKEKFDARYLSEPAEQVYAEVEEELPNLPTTLTDEERSIVLLLAQDYMQTEIAKEFGMTKTQMESAMRRIRLKMAQWRPTTAASPAPVVPLRAAA